MASSEGKMKTEFAPAERSAEGEIERQSGIIAGPVTFEYVADYISNIFLILNDNRQIIFANRTAIELFKADGIDSVLGMRPGEALGCDHSDQTEGGCGTTEFCSTCGMVKSIVTTIGGQDSSDECHLTLKDGDALDLQVYTFNTKYNGDKFVATVLTDISDEKRKNMLERIFFHDIMNTLGALRGFTELLPVVPTAEKKEEVVKTIYGLTNRVIDEVNAQRDLVKAENRDLELTIGTVNTLELLRELREAYEKHDVAQDKIIEIDAGVQEIEFKSDKTLLARVVGNMLKNALEASAKGDTITLNSAKVDSAIEFSVHNPSFMPREIQLQVFKRSFSTKGAARGLGTYSMRLLSERYLKGVVSFTSSEEDGTTFTARYPLVLK
jgi:nitrogen fixation/metabolism regulation signal transduction histidine kinase